ncbi:4-hydroxy-2-oxoheptanedioate aldolase [Halomonas salipaludis]|uniref:2,4-dihydroxyhept-2-ene-1,7-dioic acid aldolase n=1 Tax=Halomonas salipaludis TaxID=2032625 RepID=A0A2A2EP82_9GAMM|nr:4-hydroxy-2-oxoheptanedioate aldolase [Halomonas salipaludis]PAU75261.1 2,4-dihydroxyhept-2-ene-1,7-dioic acid aldolase [Halomonas salipaludis]
MELPVNRFKQALANGRSQIGLWCAMADAYGTEIGAAADFDWLLIDAEHGPNDVRSILAQLQAVAPYATHPVVRPVNGDADTLKPLLDAGVQTLLVPMVESADQARAIVAATRYPPHGRRGVGAGLARASRWGRVPDYVHCCHEQLCVLLQVESRTGLEHLDDIATIDGVDGVFIGAADLAADLGYLGQPDHPQVNAAVLDAFQRIQAAGKPAGSLTVNEALAHEHLAAGCRFLAVGVDAALLARATDALLRRFKYPDPPSPCLVGGY